MRTLVDLTYVQAQSLTAAVDFAGGAIDIWQHFGFAVQASWTSTSSLTGSLKLQASNDKSLWTDLANPVAISGSSGSNLWNVTDAFYHYVRIYYAHTSGTGVLSATILAKGV